MIKKIDSETQHRYFTIQRNIYLHAKKVSVQNTLITPYLLLYNIDIPNKLSEIKKKIKLFRDDLEEYVVWHKIKDDKQLKDLITNYRPYYFYVEWLEDE